MLVPRMFKIISLLVLVYLIWSIYFPKKNNKCKTFTDYYFPEGNDNCHYDPDVDLETPDLIKKYAGNVEIYEVITDDGYILTLFRIPQRNPKGVILLHHSIFTYSRIYLFQGNQSFAMTLWHEGFDVWLGNQRGTSYSDRHINMTKFDFQYWNFSIHEMGLYDVSAEVRLIKKKTNGSKVIYFGHSLGGSIGLVYASLKPREAQSHIKDMILLSPATSMKYIGYPMHFMKLLVIRFRSFAEFFEIGSPFVNRDLFVSVTKTFTRILPLVQFFTATLMWIFNGFTPEETNPLFYSPDMFAYINNFSWKIYYHFVQNVSYFKMYDYGVENNLDIYGSPMPPFYPVEEISVPTLMISSSSDALISQEDSSEIFERFSSEAKIHGHWKLADLNHLDFIIGLNWKEKFGQKLLGFLNKLSS